MSEHRRIWVKKSESSSGFWETEVSNVEACKLETDFMNAECFVPYASFQKLESELAQQRFNNEHNLSIDQKVADRIEKLESDNKGLGECVAYYANTEIYRRPDRDRDGMGGMSSRTDFEIDDGEWRLDLNFDKDHYCYGKRAREALKKISEIK